jgi:hypothetical protein
MSNARIDVYCRFVHLTRCQVVLSGNANKLQPGGQTILNSRHKMRLFILCQF